MNMKRTLLPVLAAALTLALASVSCGNKPAFEQLKASVDSANVYYAEQPELTAPDVDLQYDEVTNTVKFIYTVNAKMAAFAKENIGYTEDMMLRTLPYAPYNLGRNMADANASMMIVYTWEPDGHLEYLIESDRIKEACREATDGR